MVAHLCPNRQQSALTFVVAGLPDVGLAKVPCTIGPSTAATIWPSVSLSGSRANT